MAPATGPRTKSPPEPPARTGASRQVQSTEWKGVGELGVWPSRALVTRPSTAARTGVRRVLAHLPAVMEMTKSAATSGSQMEGLFFEKCTSTQDICSQISKSDCDVHKQDTH